MDIAADFTKIREGNYFYNNDPAEFGLLNFDNILCNTLYWNQPFPIRVRKTSVNSGESLAGLAPGGTFEFAHYLAGYHVEGGYAHWYDAAELRFSYCCTSSVGRVQVGYVNQWNTVSDRVYNLDPLLLGDKKAFSFVAAKGELIRRALFIGEGAVFGEVHLLDIVRVAEHEIDRKRLPDWARHSMSGIEPD